MSSMDFSKIIIRHAAGKIFLLDTDVSAGVYHKPIIINETGEMIISLIKDGNDKSEVAAILSEKFGISQEEMLSDVEFFISSIEDSIEVWV